MDVSNYRIRVIRPEPSRRMPTTKASSKSPIDIEGTLLELDHASREAHDVLVSGNWFKVFFGGLSIYATVRWDNDHKSSIAVAQLAICSFGTLTMCWPLYGPSKEVLSHKFDNRRAEERHPRTGPKGPSAMFIKDKAFESIAARYELKTAKSRAKKVSPLNNTGGWYTSTSTSRSSAKVSVAGYGGGMSTAFSDTYTYRY